MVCIASKFKGKRSEKVFWNASIGDMASSLNALSTMRNYPGGPLTGTFDAPLNAPTLNLLRTITLTFNTGYDVREEVRIVDFGLQTDTATENLHLRTENRRSQNASTVQGRSGFVSGTYDVHAYAMVYRDIHSQSGKLVTELV